MKNNISTSTMMAWLLLATAAIVWRYNRHREDRAARLTTNQPQDHQPIPVASTSDRKVEIYSITDRQQAELTAGYQWEVDAKGLVTEEASTPVWALTSVCIQHNILGDTQEVQCAVGQNEQHSVVKILSSMSSAWPAGSYSIVIRFYLKAMTTHRLVVLDVPATMLVPAVIQPTPGIGEQPIAESMDHTVRIFSIRDSVATAEEGLISDHDWSVRGHNLVTQTDNPANWFVMSALMRHSIVLRPGAGHLVSCEMIVDENHAIIGLRAPRVTNDAGSYPITIEFNMRNEYEQKTETICVDCTLIVAGDNAS